MTKPEFIISPPIDEEETSAMFGMAEVSDPGVSIRVVGGKGVVSVPAQTDLTPDQAQALLDALRQAIDIARGVKPLEPDFLTVRETAGLLSLTPQGINRAINAKRLPATRTAQGWRVRREDALRHQRFAGRGRKKKE